MFAIDETELAWLKEHRNVARLIAAAAAFIYVAYAAIDWAVAPEMLSTTLGWRIAGALACLVPFITLSRKEVPDWAPRSIAVTCIIATTIPSVIFLVLLHTPDLAMAALMQVLMAIIFGAALRTVVRATLIALVVSVNLALWWIDAPLRTYMVSNSFVFSAAILMVVISENSFRSYRVRKELEAKLQLQATIVQSSVDAIIGRALDGTVTSWNPGAQKLFGYDAQEMIGRSMQPLFAPDRTAEEDARLQQMIKGQAVLRFETTRFCKNGERKELSISTTPIRDIHGTVIGVSEITRDVTDRNRIARELNDHNERFRAAIETTTDGFWALNSTGKLIDTNLAYCHLSGYTREELLNMRVTDLEAKEDAEATAQHIKEITRNGSANFETVHRRKDGTTWPVEVITTFSPTLGGQFFAFFKDLTERKKIEAQTWRQANFDHLTGLPNRALLFDRLNQECILARRNHTKVALLFADLDGFKVVNDNFGHQAGDLVLQEVARRWQATVRESDTVARLGGDEFSIVMSGVQNNNDIVSLAEKLLAVLAEPIQLIEGAKCQVGVSIGIAIFPTDAAALDILISRADSAMYESKRRGKNTFSFT